MHLTRRAVLQSAGATIGAWPMCGREAAPSAGPSPSLQQLAWSKLEYYNFLHFTVNTFTDREWGNGDEDPAIFNPTAFDADAICETLRDSGSKGVILTCKHHDGFCLWPTKTTEHCIRKGDMVKEISEAAQRHGLKFGVYLSPWDRNNAAYGTPQYIDIYRRQMRELLTTYGPIFEIWHDGANGGSGYYGGANETRTIDKQHYYDWDNTWKLERELQPDACRFSDVGPDIRWVGNEKGTAGDPCWATFTPRGRDGRKPVPGDLVESELKNGTRGGKFWMPAECDVSIRPGWFWHEAENSKVKTPKELFDLYLASVGRGASLLLNVPPDRRGLLHEADTASLREFGKMQREIFGQNLARYGALQVASGENPLQPLITISLPGPRAFNLIRLREDITNGHNVEEFKVEYQSGGLWSKFGSGTSIGSAHIVQSESVVVSNLINVQCSVRRLPFAFSEIGVFNSKV